MYLCSTIFYISKIEKPWHNKNERQNQLDPNREMLTRSEERKIKMTQHTKLNIINCNRVP